MTKYEVPTTDDRHIWDLWLSHIYQGAIVVADDMGIFTALNERTATISELAERLDFDERATGVLVRLLASLGLLVPRQERFQLTDEARLYLLKSSPYYWGHMMHVGVNQWHQSTLAAALKKKNSGNAAGPEGMPKSAGTGRSVDGWAEGIISLEQAGDIAARMHSHSLVPAIGAARNYDFTGINSILDVGGGSGCFMIAIAQAHREMRSTILELPAMCAVAQTYIKTGGVADRVDTLAIDMFRQPWPRGYDAVFFSNVWHDWNFRTCTWLAARAYEILPGGGRIMLHEMLLDDDGAGPAAAAGFSMLMLLATQGQQFTFAELRTILENVGFAGIESKHTSGYYSITTGYKR
jgi:acetylserotonin N-methyltransferase